MNRSEDSTVLESLQAQLAELGVDLSALGCEGGAAVKVICVPSNLSHSLSSLAESPRNQVLMVRVDSNTAEALDAWVDTGAVKSRSEAAALFIREGLRIREDELGALEETLQSVREAREKLRAKAREVLGSDLGSD